MPLRIARLPVHRGYPVPAFVAWVDGQGEQQPTGQGAPDFRVVAGNAMALAHNFKWCWICGQPLGANLAFVIGPMCAITRTNSEPPSHQECADWSVQACPFLTRPHMERREGNMPPGHEPPAGFALARNPGVTAVWTTRSYTAWRPPGDIRGVLFTMGDPTNITWHKEGRPATRDEIMESVDGGLPALQAMADAQDKAEQWDRASRKLAEQVATFKQLLPTDEGDEWRP